MWLFVLEGAIPQHPLCVPLTSVLGAILLTGCLGGAVAAHMRVGSPIFEAYIFPILVGALVWGGILLSDLRLRALIPLRRDSITQAAIGAP